MTPEISARSGPLPESLRSRLERALARYGMKRLRAATCLSETTIWKGLARGSLYFGSQAAFERGLDQIEREAP
jgi:hypothetical protein